VRETGTISWPNRVAYRVPKDLRPAPVVPEHGVGDDVDVPSQKSVRLAPVEPCVPVDQGAAGSAFRDELALPVADGLLGEHREATEVLRGADVLRAQAEAREEVAVVRDLPRRCRRRRGTCLTARSPRDAFGARAGLVSQGVEPLPPKPRPWKASPLDGGGHVGVEDLVRAWRSDA
jgi:hypothetical protein